MITLLLPIKCTINACGLRCPEPLLKVRQALNVLCTGEYVEVIATDPASVKDFHRMAELTKNTLVEFEQQEHIYRYVLKKGL
ncbi:MAG: sulfurtransferase TusA family protein [Cellvibrionaceae bacterium]